jgi:hypothetical protein
MNNFDALKQEFLFVKEPGFYIIKDVRVVKRSSYNVDKFGTTHVMSYCEILFICEEPIFVDFMT